MSTNRTILISIVLLAIVGVGIYFSRNTDLNGLVNNGLASATSANSATTTPITDCSFDTTEIPEHLPVIVSEIAWMGTASSSNHEWIELANLSSSTISIGGWELTNQSGKLKVVFRSGAKITAGGFYLLERGSVNFLPNIKADNFYTGILKNTGDSLRLFDKYCSLIDSVVSGSAWPAGNNTEKRTMERDSKTFSWYTSSEIGGTPRAENGPAFVKPTPVPKTSKKTSTKTKNISTTTLLALMTGEYG